jgi:ABC-2 type transport system ATP-binding protein
VIRTLNLSKKFGEFSAVSGLNLEIKRGELFGFLGPNGAGKTTTIKMLTGLLKPSEGKVLIGGYDIEKEPLGAKRIIGYIPDQPYLYRKLTGREFLEFMANLYEIKVEREKIEGLLDLFELDGWGEELIENYSHGMRQKLIFSASLIHEPQVIIIDEPMVGLDPRSARLVKNILRKKCAEGATVFVSTHGIKVAEEICSRIGIIREGRLIAQGTMKELRKEARLEKRDLEGIFLKLTEEQA